MYFFLSATLMCSQSILGLAASGAAAAAAAGLVAAPASAADAVRVWFTRRTASAANVTIERLFILGSLGSSTCVGSDAPGRVGVTYGASGRVATPFLSRPLID